MSVAHAHHVCLRSSLVVVREVDRDDAEEAFAWGSDPGFFTYLPFEPVESMDEEREFIDGLIDVARCIPRDDYHLAVTDAITQAIVGMVRLKITSARHRTAELGFGIRKDARGRGFATEAARLLVGFGFGTLGLHRVAAGHHPDNDASARVIDRLGMTREGRLRENLLAHGTWRDTVVYSILDHEWHPMIEPSRSDWAPNSKGGQSGS